MNCNVKIENFKIQNIIKLTNQTTMQSAMHDSSHRRIVSIEKSG